MKSLMMNKLLFLQRITDSPSTTIISTFIVTIISIVFLYTVLFIRTTKNKQKTAAPKASGAWPFIGHLKLFMKQDTQFYRTLGTMSDKYGSVFTLRLGNQAILVVSNWEMVKECFTTNDKSFSNRPSTLSTKYMLNDTNSVVFSPYGTYWREMRKILVQKLLISNQRSEALKNLKTKEIDNSFVKLNDLCNNDVSGGGTKVRMDEWLANMMFNIIARITFGYQSGGGDAPGASTTSKNVERYKKTLDEMFVVLATRFAVSDIFPSLEFIDRLRGLVKDMKILGDELNSIAGCFIEEHRQKRRESLSSLLSLSNESVGDEQDFIDVLLSIMDQSRLPGDDPDFIIKIMILEAFAGGTDSLSATLTWVLSLLLNHPNVLKRAREEIDRHVENGKQVEVSDIPKLGYIDAIIKETMRLYPVGALSERYTTEECEVGRFNVPAGTRLLVNIWKIHRDPSVWENPSDFQPERFLCSDKVGVDLYGQNYELIPFGAGRRVCPAIVSSLQTMHYALARLIQGYEMKSASLDGKVNMDEMIAMSCHKMSPLEVIISPREPRRS